MMINGRDPVPRIGKRATRYGGRSGEDDCVRRALPITSSSSTSRTLSLSSRTDGDRLVGKPKRIRSWLAALPSPDYPCRWGGSCRQLQVGRGGWAFGAIQSWNFSGVARCLSTPCGYVGTTDLGGAVVGTELVMTARRAVICGRRGSQPADLSKADFWSFGEGSGVHRPGG